jgi:hypothetical protein
MATARENALLALEGLSVGDAFVLRASSCETGTFPRRRGCGPMTPIWRYRSWKRCKSMAGYSRTS